VVEQASTSESPRASGRVSRTGAVVWLLPVAVMHLRGDHMHNKRFESARSARPTRKGDAPLLAAQAQRWAENN
jgi:hypothetical protein